MRDGEGPWVWNSSTERFLNMQSRVMLQCFAMKPGITRSKSVS